MSITNPPARPTMFPAVQRAVEQCLNEVRPYLDSLVRRGAPTPATMRALAEELNRALSDPRRVSHPELVDPQVFWEKSAWPQAAAIVKNARGALLAIAEELATVVSGSEQVLDAWLAAQIEASAAQPDHSPDAARDAAVDAIVSHCEALHRLIARLEGLAPGDAHLRDARTVVDEARHRHAEQSTHAQREVESRSVDESHRAAFERAWSEGLAQDIAVRSEELRATAPYRHQDLLLIAHQKAAEAIADDIEALVQELTEPILGIGERMVRRYDELVCAVPAPTPAPPYVSGTQ